MRRLLLPLTVLLVLAGCTSDDIGDPSEPLPTASPTTQESAGDAAGTPDPTQDDAGQDDAGQDGEGQDGDEPLAEEADEVEATEQDPPEAEPGELEALSPRGEDQWFVLQTVGIDTDDGTLEFGAEPDVVVEALTTRLGEPDQDTGEVAAGPETCVSSASSVRVATWSGLEVRFLDGAFAGFTSTNADDYAEVLLDGDAVGVVPMTTTLGGLRTDVGDQRLLVLGDDDPFPPGFIVNGDDGELAGFLTGTDDASFVESVEVGAQCGE